MSKYLDIAKQVNQAEDVVTRAEKAAPILEMKLKAIIASQNATVMELEANLAEKESLVNKARGYITTDAKAWVSNLDKAKDARDEAAEELRASQQRLDEIKEEVKIFS